MKTWLSLLNENNTQAKVRAAFAKDDAKIAASHTPYKYNKWLAAMKKRGATIDVGLEDATAFIPATMKILGHFDFKRNVQQHT